jgi:hypothetical protein
MNEDSKRTALLLRDRKLAEQVADQLAQLVLREVGRGAERDV